MWSIHMGCHRLCFVSTSTWLVRGNTRLMFGLENNSRRQKISLVNPMIVDILCFPIHCGKYIHETTQFPEYGDASKFTRHHFYAINKCHVRTLHEFIQHPVLYMIQRNTWRTLPKHISSDIMGILFHISINIQPLIARVFFFFFFFFFFWGGGGNMGPVWGRQEPGGPHVGPMNFAIWDTSKYEALIYQVHLNITSVISEGQLTNVGHTMAYRCQQ